MAGLRCWRRAEGRRLASGAALARGQPAGSAVRGVARRAVAAVQEAVASKSQPEVGKTVELLDKEARAPLASARAQRLKDKVYLKEMRAAITSGEFALRLRGAEQPGLIDYQGLCSRFEAFAWKLRFQPLDASVLPQDEANGIMETLESMSSRLEDLAQERAGSHRRGEASATEAAAALAEEAPAEPKVDLPDPRKFLYLREDQAVDLDGALSEANKAARFSRDLWERLNGGGELEAEEDNENEKIVVPETPAIAERQRRCKEAQSLLAEAEADLAQLLADASDPKTLGRSSELRKQLREAEQLARDRKCRTLLTSIDLTLESAASVLEADLERTRVSEWEKVGGQLKLSVVEFSLLDKQATYYQQFMPEDPEVCIGEVCLDFTGVLDPEELAVLESDCAEFATGVGIEEADSNERKTPFTDVQRLVAQVEKNLEKAKVGLTFYTLGAQLLWQDLQYGSSLFSKAAFSNYTLKPREVRAIQRTAKDLVTLVPFLIILIIPLSPIGHVLVFSFIQKFFPDFFPSTFTERRQNVVKIYQDIIPEGGAAQRT